MNLSTSAQELSIKLLDKRTLENGSIAASYEIEPLERGFGLTMGNTLRRICLSHLEGTAVTSVRIQGVTHEFSTMNGVLEDVVEIVLNCKSVIFETESPEEFSLNVNFQGPGEVRAADFEVPAGVRIMNPNVLIATITEAVPFVAEMTARKGRGYVLADEHPTTGRSLDVIQVDSTFMPIRKFSYHVEQIRIGEFSEASSNKYEKLIVELVSNGAIEPDKAISQAAKLLMQKLTPFMNLTGESLPVINVAPVEQSKKEEDHSDVGIETLNLSVRAYNCLKRANKNTLQDLLQMTTDELMGIKNFGKKSAEEVIRILNEKGLYLSDDPRRVDGGGNPGEGNLSSAESSDPFFSLY